MPIPGSRAVRRILTGQPAFLALFLRGLWMWLFLRIGAVVLGLLTGVPIAPAGVVAFAAGLALMETSSRRERLFWANLGISRAVLLASLLAAPVLCELLISLAHAGS